MQNAFLENLVDCSITKKFWEEIFTTQSFNNFIEGYRYDDDEFTQRFKNIESLTENNRCNKWTKDYCFEMNFNIPDSVEYILNPILKKIDLQLKDSRKSHKKNNDYKTENKKIVELENYKNHLNYLIENYKSLIQECNMIKINKYNSETGNNCSKSNNFLKSIFVNQGETENIFSLDTNKKINSLGSIINNNHTNNKRSFIEKENEKSNTNRNSTISNTINPFNSAYSEFGVYGENGFLFFVNGLFKTIQDEEMENISLKDEVINSLNNYEQENSRFNRFKFDKKNPNNTTENKKFTTDKKENNHNLKKGKFFFNF